VQSQQRLCVSVLSWNHLFSTVWRSKGESIAREKMNQLAQLPIEIVDVSEAEAAAAAKLSATYGLEYFDCIAAATAQQPLLLGHKLQQSCPLRNPVERLLGVGPTLLRNRCELASKFILGRRNLQDLLL